MSRFDELPRDYNAILAHNLRRVPGSAEYFTEYRAALARELCGAEVAFVLDFGCGIGNSIPYLRENFPHAKIVGCDTSVPSIEHARQRFPGISFVDELDLPERRFDLVFVAGVIHHVDPIYRKAVMRRLAAVLAPRGTLTVFELNPHNPVTRHLVSTCIYDNDAALISRRELRRLVESEGELEVFDAGYTVFLPPVLGLLRPLERLVTWLPLGAQYFVAARRTRGK